MAGRRTTKKDAEEQQPEAPKSAVQGGFPLPEGHGFYTPTTSRRLHHGAVAGDGPAIQMVQQFLDVPVTGSYDAATLKAVYAYQSKTRGLEVTGIVDAKTWDKMAKS